VASIRGWCGGVAGRPGVSTDGVGTGGVVLAPGVGVVVSKVDVLGWLPGLTSSHGDD
jgi:hypothetical protein